MGLAVRFSGGLMPRRYHAITSGGARSSVRMDSSDQQYRSATRRDARAAYRQDTGHTGVRGREKREAGTQPRI